MPKVILTDPSTYVNDAAAVAAQTANNDAIEAAMEKTLSRDGTAPNQMAAQLDMNGYQIINLPAPVSALSPLRLTDLNSFIGGGVINAIPAGGTSGQSLTKNSNADYDVTWSTVVSGVTGKPFVILCTGQSNFTQAPSLSWTPETNAKTWNFSGVDGNVGNAFNAISTTTIRTPEKIASEIAKAYPNRPVYVINISFSGQAISHWMVGASSPDVYQNIQNNIAAALAAAGVSQIDLFCWWQGESDANPSLSTTYISDLNTVIARFQTNSWFPTSTPILMFGVSPTSVSTFAGYDTMNEYLATVAAFDPEHRAFVWPGALGASIWDGTNIHCTAAGYSLVGEHGASAYLHGIGRASVYGFFVRPNNGLIRTFGDMWLGYTTPSSGAVRSFVIWGGTGSNGGSAITFLNGASNVGQIGNASAILGGTYDATMLFYQPSSLYRFYGLTAGSLVSDASGNVSVVTRREVLSANRTYYVRTDGSDSNTGLVNSAGGAFLTIQKAIDTAVAVDGSTFNMTIQVGNGTYTAPVTLKSYIGSGTWSIVGNSATPSNVVISVTSNNCFTGTSVYGPWTIDGFKLQVTTAGNGISLFGPPTNITIQNIEFGAIATSGISVAQQAICGIASSYSVTGACSSHWSANSDGQIVATFLTITVSAVAITTWAICRRMALITCNNNTYAGAGPSAGTKKYDVTLNGVIDSNGGTLPGSVAGTNATQGLYN